MSGTGNIWTDYFGEGVDGSPRPAPFDPESYAPTPAPSPPADIDNMSGDDLLRELIREVRRTRRMLDERLP